LGVSIAFEAILLFGLEPGRVAGGVYPNVSIAFEAILLFGPMKGMLA